MVVLTEIAMQTHYEDLEDLAARCRAGDMSALRQVYADYQEDVYRYAYRLLGDREDAADVRQETFLNAFRSINRFRGDSSLKTWLLTICTNLCRTRRSAAQRRQEVEYDPATVERWLGRETASLDPLDAAVRSETARLVRVALGSLPVVERELIILREYEEMGYDEIARIMKCSPSTVGVKLFRARRRLRERIESLLGAGNRDSTGGRDSGRQDHV